MNINNRISPKLPRSHRGEHPSVTEIVTTCRRCLSTASRRGNPGGKVLGDIGHKYNGAQANRRGVTAVEFAMTAPILFLLLYAALELGHANMTFNAVEAACYEGARNGIVPGARAADCQAAAERILAISKIRGASVSVVPPSLSTSTSSVQVRISLPYAGTAIMPATFTRLLTIDRQCELVREQL